MVKAFGYRSNGTPDVQEFLELDMPTPLAADLLVQVTGPDGDLAVP